MTRIVTYNIRKGGLRRRRLIADVLAAIDADVVVLQEATDPRVVRVLAEATGCRAIIHAPGRSVAVLSRSQPAEAVWHRMARARNFAEVTLPELDLRILAVHLGAGLSGRPERRRLRQVERVLATACAGARPGSDDDRRRPQRDRPWRAAQHRRAAAPHPDAPPRGRGHGHAW